MPWLAACSTRPFVLTSLAGDCPHEAVGVAANELRDPQLALLLCRLLFGACGSPAEARLLQQLQHTAEASSASDAAAAAAVCCWMRANAEAVVRALLRGEQSRLAAAATAEHAAQLLPLLRLVLTAVPPAGDEQAGEWRRHLQRCLWALAAALRRCGLHSLAVQAAAAAQLGDAAGNGRGHREAPRRALLQHHLLAEALLPGVLEQHHRQRRHLDADAAYQLELLQQQGVAVDAPAVLSRLRHARRGILSADEHQRALAWAPPLAGLGRQQSSVGSVGGSSFRSRDAEPPRWQQQRHGTAVVADGCAGWAAGSAAAWRMVVGRVSTQPTTCCAALPQASAVPSRPRQAGGCGLLPPHVSRCGLPSRCCSHPCWQGHGCSVAGGCCKGNSRGATPSCFPCLHRRAGPPSGGGVASHGAGRRAAACGAARGEPEAHAPAAVCCCDCPGLRLSTHTCARPLTPAA